MSSRLPIAWIDLRVFAHATEDTDKVLAAARTIIPPEFLDAVVFEETTLTGHHGNPITLLKARVKNMNIIQKIFNKLSQSLDNLDKENLTGRLNQYLENGNLYIRLDKQSAYQNRLKLCPTDPVHLKIHFKKHDSQEIIDICRRSGLVS